MTYEPADDDLEVRVPRHARADTRSGRLDPSLPSVTAPQEAEYTRSSIGAPGVHDWYFFTIELQTALGAGMPFVRALTLVATGSHRRSIRRTGNLILRHLQRESGAKAIMRATTIPPLIRHMLVVGLRGGDVARVLQMVVSHYGWLLEIRGQILRVITYPAMLVILGTMVMIMRDTAVESLSGRMSVGEAGIKFSLRYGLPVLAGAIAAIIAAWVIYLPGVRPIYDRVILTAPKIGKMISQYTQAVFFRVMALLIEAGMPITNAWILATKIMPNQHLAARMEPGLRFLQDGEPLSEALRQTGLMDKDSRAMAAIGEVAGLTPNALRKYADYRDMELRSTTKMLTSLLGLPCIVIVALGYFVNPIWLSVLVFALVFVRRMV